MSSSDLERRLARLEQVVSAKEDNASDLREVLTAWGIPLPDHADGATLFQTLLAWMAGKEAPNDR